ncbi:phosphopantetheine-binding protein [Dactylosporangium sp. NPDC049140]|uniref:phosphopantetheine-binding protein n=1 Tax=Dactylosporangium sp. NPDC049140 TaxID=3155647 RepID=UPI0033D18694
MTPEEAAVARIWTGLGLRPTSAGDDFFDLGGESLTLVGFLARVQHEMGLELPVDELFEEDLTVAFAARVIDKARMAAALAELDGMSDAEVAQLLSRAD